MPTKRDRVQRVATSHALVVILQGAGSFRSPGGRKAEPVHAPGWFLITPGQDCDYGPVAPGEWEEIFWNISGPRREEWERAGWWQPSREYHPLSPAAVGESREIFLAAALALEKRDRAGLDKAKLRLEQWICEQGCSGSPHGHSL